MFLIFEDVLFRYAAKTMYKTVCESRFSEEASFDYSYDFDCILFLQRET